MKFEDALKDIPGAQSVGGDLIVVVGGKSVKVGKAAQGNLILDEDDDAKAAQAAVGLAVDEKGEVTYTQPEGAATHEVKVDDKVEAKDQHGSKK